MMAFQKIMWLVILFGSSKSFKYEYLIIQWFTKAKVSNIRYFDLNFKVTTYLRMILKKIRNAF